MFENDDFKGNSNASKGVRQQPVTSNVIVKKESEGSKFKKKFFAEDIKTVSGHVVDSIVIPSLQKIFSDIVKGGIDFLIYGNKSSRSNSGPGIISYNNYYNRNGIVSPYTNPINGGVPTKPATVYTVNEVIFRERANAEEVLLRMKEAISNYGMVSVGDFYDLIEQRSSFTDQKYGWKDLSSAEIMRENDGYSIRFPRVVVLE